MKRLTFVGNSLRCLREFPKDVMHDAGYQLEKLQRGDMPDDFKPMPSIGVGVEEVRIRDQSGIYRAIYTARFQSEVLVLHAFQKKTQATAKNDIELARNRYREIVKESK